MFFSSCRAADYGGIDLARAGSNTIVGSLAGFSLLTGFAMHAYPGGTAWDPTTRGHDFWLNYLCDLARTTALNGEPNAVASGLARGALLLLGVGALVLWWCVPALFGDASGLRGAVVQALGASSAFGILGVALLPPDRFGALHPALMLLTGPPGLAAATCAIVGLRPREPLASAMGAAGLLVAGADFTLYVGQLAGRDAGPILAVLERIALMLGVAWMGIVAWRLRRPVTRDRTRPACNRGRAD